MEKILNNSGFFELLIIYYFSIIKIDTQFINIERLVLTHYSFIYERINKNRYNIMVKYMIKLFFVKK